MNDLDSNSAESWAVCSPGTLGQLGRRIRFQRRRQAAIRVATPLAMIVLVTLGAWSVNRPTTPLEFNYGGVTCRQVEANMHQYALRQLPTETQRAFAEHMAHCPHCQEKMEAMKRHRMPIGASTAVVTESPIAVLTQPTGSRDENFPERLTLHRRERVFHR